MVYSFGTIILNSMLINEIKYIISYFFSFSYYFKLFVLAL